MWGSLKGPSLRHPELICPYTFKALRRQLGLPERREHEPGMIDAARSNDSELCREMLTVYGLSEEQMLHAAERYRLGRSRSGKTIYWMIDETGAMLDGHIGSAPVGEEFSSSWVSTLLKRRYPEAASLVPFPHCLFGLHLLGETMNQDPLTMNQRVCVVEREPAAVVLSELYPDSLWLAYVYPANLLVERFKPLEGRRITLFPSTDPSGDEYFSTLELADQVRHHYPTIDLSVSSILEDHATAEQKQRGIDILNFLFEQ